MIQWNDSPEFYRALLNEAAGHTENGQPKPNLQEPDPTAEAFAARYCRENPQPKGGFWDRRWAGEKARNPKLTDADRPPWLKESIPPRVAKEMKATAACDKFVNQSFAL